MTFEGSNKKDKVPNFRKKTFDARCLKHEDKVGVGNRRRILNNPGNYLEGATTDTRALVKRMAEK